MSELSLGLLGPPQVTHGGAPVEVDTRKATALLAYLALTPGAHGRDRLAGLLWPDYEPERARASLRRTLSALVKGLGGRWVTADRRAVRLDRDGVWLDVEDFRAALRAAGEATDAGSRVGHLTAAAELYRGDFLAGFSVRDSPEFDDWQFFTAESLRRELAGALEALTETCTTTGELQRAIDHARRWSALDPLHEPAHRALMQLYAWTDQRGAALRQYRECVKILDRELGVPALEETHELYEAIKENRLPPRPAEAVPARPLQFPGTGPARGPARTIDRPPSLLVGREAEQQALRSAYEQATHGVLAVVEGEAGAGKTALLEDFVEQVRARGGTALVARCFEGEQHLPYGPFVAALRELLDDPGARKRLDDVADSRWAEVGRLVPEVAPRGLEHDPLGADDAGAQMRLLDAVTHVLTAGLSADPPGVLAVDDVHCADAASLTLLAYVARRLAGSAVCVVVSWRSDAVGPAHPLRRVSREPETASAIVLPRLARDDVERFVDDVRPETDAATRARLWEETEGVPLFVVEYLAALATGAHLESWTLATGVRDLFASRLEALSETAHQLLTAAAVISRSFDFATLRDASGRGDEETVSGLEELLERGLLREEPGEPGGEPGYDFTHHQLRAYVLAGMSLARLRLLHGRVAAALSGLQRGRRSTAALQAQIAWHLRESGHDEAAAEQYVLAGEQARAVHANAEALAHFEAALALGVGSDAGLHTAIAELHTLAGRYEEAVRRYETAAALAAPAELPHIEHRLGAVRDRMGDWELAADHFRAALRLLGADAAAGTRARILADASLTSLRRGDRADAQDLATEALSLAEAEEGADPLALAQAHNLLGVLATRRGDTAAALTHLDRSLAVADDHGDILARAGALNNLALAYRSAGQVDKALPLAEEAVRLARQAGDRHRLAAAIGNVADLLRDAGRIGEAEARVREAVEILAGIGGAEPRPEIWKLTEW